MKEPKKDELTSMELASVIGQAEHGRFVDVVLSGGLPWANERRRFDRQDVARCAEAMGIQMDSKEASR